MSDDSGRLKGMIWETDHDTEGNSIVQVNKLDLGTASPASSLTYLDFGHLFLSSACADSQLLKLRLPTTIPPGSPVSPKSSPRSPISRKGKGRVNHEDVASRSITVGRTATGSTEVLERWMNLAPVKDFAVVGDESGGTVRITPAYSVAMSPLIGLVSSGNCLWGVKLQLASFSAEWCRSGIVDPYRRHQRCRAHLVTQTRKVSRIAMNPGLRLVNRLYSFRQHNRPCFYTSRLILWRPSWELV